MAIAAWLAQFPGLDSTPAEVLEALSASARVVSLPAGARIYEHGRAPESYLLLLEGSVRVHQLSDKGREIVLYRVGAGESCVLTTSCLMAYEDYPAEAVAETAVRAVVVPRATFDDLLSRSPDFRRFVFTAFSARVTDLFRLIDEVVFARMDNRLAGKLLELSQGGERIAVTQQQLASELGSAREVVSRVLGEFQRRGWVSAERGGIFLHDRAALERLAREK